MGASSPVRLSQVTPVSATSLAIERMLPVDDTFASLFHTPGAERPGLVRGQVIHCTGAAPLSMALALAAAASRAGAWLAVVDVPGLGVEATGELGVLLERLVRVETGPAGQWADVMCAVADGFELIVTEIPRGVSAATARRVHQRIRARGGVLLTTASGRSGSPMSSDLDVRTVSPQWKGLGAGHGYLRARRLVVEASGRRLPQTRSIEVWLPGPTGRPEPVDGEVIDLTVAAAGA